MWLWVVVAWVIFLFPKKDLPTVTTTTTTSEPSKSHTRIHKRDPPAQCSRRILRSNKDETRKKKTKKKYLEVVHKYCMHIKLRHGLREKVHVERTRNTSVLPLRHSIISCGEQAHYSDFIFHFLVGK